MSKFVTVKEFIEDVRARLGDTSCEIPERGIISWLNLTLPRLAREPGLDKLFKFHDTFELASINADGTKAASWTLNSDSGEIIDIKTLRVLDNSGCGVFDVSPCFVQYDRFFDCNPLPEDREPGTPSTFTIEEMGGNTKIIFDRPIDKPHAIDMVYTAFHPRIRTVNDEIRLTQGFIDILNEYVTIMYNQESSDMATARALLEDLDLLTDSARELLARTKSGMPFRTMNASF